MKKLRGEAGTSLYDAIYPAQGERISDREGRRVLIVVTDGADTVSIKNYHDALRAAHDADAVVYGILIVPITNDAGPAHRRRTCADRHHAQHGRKDVYAGSERARPCV